MATEKKPKKPKKPWKSPEVREVRAEEDSTSMQCQGKAIGCYAGSSCGSIPKEMSEPQPGSEK